MNSYFITTVDKDLNIAWRFPFTQIPQYTNEAFPTFCRKSLLTTDDIEK